MYNLTLVQIFEAFEQLTEEAFHCALHQPSHYSQEIAAHLDLGYI